MNGFLHCALCFTKSNISQAYTHTYTQACWLVLIVYSHIYIYIWLGRVGTIHHLKRSKYTTVIRLEAAAAPRTPWPEAREHFGKCPLLTLSSVAHSPVPRARIAARPTTKTRWLPRAHLSPELSYYYYYTYCIYIIILLLLGIISIQMYSGTLYLCRVFVMRSFFFITIFIHTFRDHTKKE